MNQIHRFFLLLGLSFVLFGGQWPANICLGSSLSDPPSQSQTLSPIITERKLPNGTVCRVALYGLVSSAGRMEKLDQLGISISGKPVQVPSGVFSDLHDIAPNDGFTFSDFAGETDVQFNGGEGTNAWRVKLIIHQYRVDGRIYFQGHQAPKQIRYLKQPIAWNVAHFKADTNITFSVKQSISSTNEVSK